MRRDWIIAVLIMCSLTLSAQIKVIKAGKFIDVVGGKVLTNQIIIIEGNKIVQVGSSLVIPKDASVIDLSKATVLPGLIDCHTHLGLLGPENQSNYYKDFATLSAVDIAVLMPTYARKTLEAGFTTIRDVGAFSYTDVALRNAIKKKAIPGPRMLISVFPIGSTGGHADFIGFSPLLGSKEPASFTGVSDGVDEVRKKVRENIKYGADLIKVMASGGVLTEEELVGATQYTQEELNALCDEAHRWGKSVAAHAHGTEAIKMAVRAGVQSIEHGSLIDDEGIALMKENQVYLVADIYNDTYILSEYERLGYPETIIAKERQVGQEQRLNFQKAVKAGVKIAYGTDAGVYPHGDNAKQFSYMVKYGMQPMQAIQSATIHAADLLGLKKEIGSIEPEKIADIIAVEGDVLENISSLEKVFFVMQEGQIVKSKAVTSSEPKQTHGLN